MQYISKKYWNNRCCHNIVWIVIVFVCIKGFTYSHIEKLSINGHNSNVYYEIIIK